MRRWLGLVLLVTAALAAGCSTGQDAGMTNPGTDLLAAAGRGDAEAVSAALETGADLENRDATDGRRRT